MMLKPQKDEHPQVDDAKNNFWLQWTIVPSTYQDGPDIFVSKYFAIELMHISFCRSVETRYVTA